MDDDYTRFIDMVLFGFLCFSLSLFGEISLAFGRKLVAFIIASLVVVNALNVCCYITFNSK